ncbi:hypothetical protein CCACVL1_07080 [Corchorus capsularis]|uniref:Uncharacterized protein n=1 Tax=Corchorus capsularis TaxID=210143 RepID=A0A1R3J9N7_COCAP|nr:hypothetical protein CCACVL1_07080 [Corchorus capsularis]
MGATDGAAVEEGSGRITSDGIEVEGTSWTGALVDEDCCCNDDSKEEVEGDNVAPDYRPIGAEFCKLSRVGDGLGSGIKIGY